MPEILSTGVLRRRLRLCSVKRLELSAANLRGRGYDNVRCMPFGVISGACNRGGPQVNLFRLTSVPRHTSSVLFVCKNW